MLVPPRCFSGSTNAWNRLEMHLQQHCFAAIHMHRLTWSMERLLDYCVISRDRHGRLTLDIRSLQTMALQANNFLSLSLSLSSSSSSSSSPPPPTCLLNLGRDVGHALSRHRVAQSCDELL